MALISPGSSSAPTSVGAFLFVAFRVVLPHNFATRMGETPLSFTSKRVSEMRKAFFSHFRASDASKDVVFINPGLGSLLIIICNETIH